MNIEEIGKFVTAGHAVFYLLDKKDGKRRVYKIQKDRQFEGGKRQWHVSLRCVQDGESAYAYVGAIKNRQLNHTMYSVYSDESAEYNFFEWFFLHIIRHKELPKTMEFGHMGRCGKCHKLLLDPNSVDRGIGPTCIQNI